MKHSNLVIAAVGILILTGCSRKTAMLEDHLQNPLFAERYAESVVDRLVELEIVKDPALEDSAKKSYLDTERKKWLEITRNARQAQRDGMQGDMIALSDFANGDVLYVQGALYFGTLFEIDPLPSLHIYLTTVVDPRDVKFPDATAMDLGELQSAYGAQTYAVPSVDNPLLYRTVVLWDTAFGRLHSFAQLSK
jgi:hypothetical protein